jgi:hypothetical protein
VTNKTEKTNFKEDSFWAIRSTGKAFVIRGSELVLLSAIVSFAYFYFPDLNFWTVLAVGILTATTFSFVLYKTFYRGENKSMPEESNKGVLGLFNISKEFAGIITGVASSVTFLLSQSKIGLSEKTLLITMDILNLLILLIALAAIKATSMEFDGNEVKKLNEHLIINNESDLVKIKDRVNELIRQLVHCVRWFAVILGLFYLLQLFSDSTQMPFVLFKTTVKDNYSIIDILSYRPPFYTESATYLSTEILTNITNLFSAAYLFLAFQVLFLVTLDKDDKTWRLKSFIPISLAVIITLVNVYSFVNGFFGVNLLTQSHVIRLIGGLYNGVAMFLLFSRFVAMEYFFQNSGKDWQRQFYFYGTVIVLPLYVVVQPLYGLFNAVEIGQSVELFKAVVFLVCFWGKLVFLLFIYTMLTKKWIHSYLFMVLSQKDTLSKISKDLKDVDDL